ncbi:hypothetical protein GH714_037024 [Hevea brasiliensis]|uniref:Uncharacterized protein n=1 Tax=Hevea brasiliensis TaxID=3981 RepID=A0A6A6MG17_HEVBR|nr:hypothetical protein GH714_037024 [Hevea brasiliensis]
MMVKKETSSSSHGVFEDFDNDDGDNGRIKAMIGITAARCPNSQVIVEEGTAGTGGVDEEGEQKQFRKGLGKRMDDASGTNRVFTSSTTAVMHNQQQQQQRPVMYVSVPSIIGASGASQGLDALSISQQAEIARNALQDNVRRLKKNGLKSNVRM